MRILIAALLVTLTAGTGWAKKAEKDKPALATEEQKTLYALGVAMGTAVANFSLTPAETEFVLMGVKDSIAVRKPQVEMAVYGPQIAKLEAGRTTAKLAEQRKKASAFLEKAAKEPGVVALDQGVLYTELAAGSGPTPSSSDTFRAHYRGTLVDGTPFSSSHDAGEPYQGDMASGSIPCWRTALLKMKVGGKARLVCPSETAYGDHGRPPRIPGGAALIFEVELLGLGAQ
ncbi:MAG: FKBP-type peptidyl-prolyl cis-trans isomerase [Elusimicrobia bacterium]|nr:FKBP-type peptidyl-prolyl cis-trans isomerase [Elusimicrobiota bacterium]